MSYKRKAKREGRGSAPYAGGETVYVVHATEAERAVIGDRGLERQMLELAIAAGPEGANGAIHAYLVAQGIRGG